jgi:hypothetical protein
MRSAPLRFTHNAFRISWTVRQLDINLYEWIFNRDNFMPANNVGGYRFLRREIPGEPFGRATPRSRRPASANIHQG